MFIGFCHVRFVFNRIAKQSVVVTFEVWLFGDSLCLVEVDGEIVLVGVVE